MPKNILLIMTDQMHKYALGTLSPFVHTPNLDRLAREGTLFTNAYSNNPVCGPFRGILYSGRYCKDSGVLKNEMALRPDEISLANELEQAGYDTSFVGKLHLGESGNCPIPPEYRAGHRHFLGYQCYNGFFKDVCFYDEDQAEHRFQEHRTDVTARLGIDRMRMLARGGKPFCTPFSFRRRITRNSPRSNMNVCMTVSRSLSRSSMGRSIPIRPRSPRTVRAHLRTARTISATAGTFRSI